MPTYLYFCENSECNKEFEDFHSMNAPVPPCPHCKGAQIKKLIHDGGMRGIVQLEGQDLIDKVKADAKQFAREAARDSNKMANLIGEDRFHKQQTVSDRVRAEVKRQLKIK